VRREEQRGPVDLGLGRGDDRVGDVMRQIVGDEA
jgi:hypothetical protein